MLLFPHTPVSPYLRQTESVWKLEYGVSGQGQPARVGAYTSYKVAQSLLEFSTSIPRTQLRPSYGEGFLGAPIQIGTREKALTPPAQGDARGSSNTSKPSTPGDSLHV